MADEPDTTDVDEIANESTEIDDATARWRRVPRPRRSRAGSAVLAGVFIVATVAGVTGWLGYRAYYKHEAQVRRDLFVRIARQGAVNLTTINYAQVDADVQRILDSATGAFRDDFAQRSKSFTEVVKAAQSRSEGTVTDAGLESQHAGSAQVLVAISVKSRTANGEQPAREWRMRVEVSSVGDAAKVSNVVFVS